MAKRSTRRNVWAECEKTVRNSELNDVQVAQATGVTRQTVKRVRNILLYTKGNPDRSLIRDLRSGAISVTKASKKIKDLKAGCGYTAKHRLKVNDPAEYAEIETTEALDGVARKELAASLESSEKGIFDKIAHRAFENSRGKSEAKFLADVATARTGRGHGTPLSMDLALESRTFRDLLADHTLDAMRAHGIPEKQLLEVLAQPFDQEFLMTNPTADALYRILTSPTWLRKKITERVYDALGGKEAAERLLLGLSRHILEGMLLAGEVDLPRYRTPLELILDTLGDPSFQEELLCALLVRERIKSYVEQGGALSSRIRQRFLL